MAAIFRIRFVLIGLVVAVGVAYGQGSEAARKSLMEADIQFDKDAAAKGLDGWMSHFGDDARTMIAKKGEIAGKQALFEHYKTMFATPGFSLRWKPIYAYASNDATLGFTYGTWKSKSQAADGTTQEGSGNYVTIWRKEGGKWKVVFDLGN